MSVWTSGSLDKMEVFSQLSFRRPEVIAGTAFLLVSIVHRVLSTHCRRSGNGKLTQTQLDYSLLSWRCHL